MRAALFIGLPGCGKSTLFRQRFVDTHLRLNLDMLRTRHREAILFEAMIRAKQPLVLDNTHLTRSERARYLPALLAAHFEVEAYYFLPDVDGCLARNAQREGRACVPPVAILSGMKRLEPPSLAEGFARIWAVELRGEGFVMQPYSSDSLPGSAAWPPSLHDCSLLPGAIGAPPGQAQTLSVPISASAAVESTAARAEGESSVAASHEAADIQPPRADNAI
ncbi:AAA family ATPase [Chitinimonas lacunae]|uniref:AAA family ATPase n=1 Tax=Chitinimonas lacunae TaxID=1963018 RepID=A0ABV8MWJ1_9NEIS